MDNNKILDYVFFALKEFNIDEDVVEESLHEMKELLDNNELTPEEVARGRASWEQRRRLDKLDAEITARLRYKQSRR